MENHHAIHGKINYFDWTIFNSFLYVYQRVDSPKEHINVNPFLNHHSKNILLMIHSYPASDVIIDPSITGIESHE
jgi:hypothetical protein